MPHYFFALTDDKTIHDFRKTIAQQFLREPLSGWSISVKDGKFEKVLSVQVSDALPPSVWRRSLDLIPTPVRPGGRRGG
jgi:hypothetical protein